MIPSRNSVVLPWPSGGLLLAGAGGRVVEVEARRRA